MNAVSVEKNLEIYEIMKILLEKELHRVYIVDENQIPLGAVSMSDILEHTYAYVAKMELSIISKPEE